MTSTVKEEILGAVIIILLDIAICKVETLLVSVLDCVCYLMLIRITSWKQTASSFRSFCSVSQSRLLPNKMSALPTSMIYRSQLWSRLSVLATVWPTTVQLGLLYMDLVHTLHTTTLCVMVVSSMTTPSIFSCQVTCPYFMCGPLNREGRLCGKCKDGYVTAIYSYTLECSKCWGHGYGWLLYNFLELFPITVMYFLVVIFHIRATSSP